MAAIRVGGLVNQYGQPIKSNSYKKDKPPPLGPSYGQWSGTPDFYTIANPFGTMGLVQFDLSQLTLSDFRSMRDHSQVNASLSVLAFMQHQSPWEIKCDNKKIRDAMQEQMETIWTSLNRAMAQANWAGYSPCVLEYENDVQGKQVVLSKVKDLLPENCVVNWKEIDGKKVSPDSMPTKIQIYDGIKQFGAPSPIPKEATFWFPILMENGDYYGRKLLRAAFTPWYFSLLIHIYANRYYERYGEPTPIGRAGFEDEVMYNGQPMAGNAYMLQILADLRNRSVVVLPNEGTEDSSGKFRYDYELSFLESQMRGADFERYMNRLDEEISLSLFTPVLLMRTADVGSYNLGQGHMQVFLWVMNGMNGDRAYYINKYILDPLVNYNYGQSAPRATIEFRKLGDQDLSTVKEVLTALINHGAVMPDLVALGEMAGMSLKDISDTIKPIAQPPVPPPDPNAPPVQPDPNAPPSDGQQNPPKTGKTGQNPPPGGAATGDKKSSSSKNAADTESRRTELYAAIVSRVRPQIVRAYKHGSTGSGLTLGHSRELAAILADEGVERYRVQAMASLRAAEEIAEMLFYDNNYKTPDEYMPVFEKMLVEYLAQA